MATINLTIADLERLLYLVACAGTQENIVSTALDLARSLDRSGRAGTVVINPPNVTGTATERQA